MSDSLKSLVAKAEAEHRTALKRLFGDNYKTFNDLIDDRRLVRSIVSVVFNASRDERDSDAAAVYRDDIWVEFSVRQDNDLEAAFHALARMIRADTSDATLDTLRMARDPATNALAFAEMRADEGFMRKLVQTVLEHATDDEVDAAGIWAKLVAEKHGMLMDALLAVGFALRVASHEVVQPKASSEPPGTNRGVGAAPGVPDDGAASQGMPAVLGGHGTDRPGPDGGMLGPPSSRGWGSSSDAPSGDQGDAG